MNAATPESWIAAKPNPKSQAVGDSRIKVKICGVTNERDLDASCELGADLIGFNFYEPSPRCLSADAAARLRQRMPDDALAVGVFVNTPIPKIESIAAAVDLDLVQFHGDEDPEAVAPMASKAIRALRVSKDFDPDEVKRWSDCWGVLFDAPAEGLYGGSGEVWAYERVGRTTDSSLRTFLAGGLTPANIAHAVRAVPHLYAVDVCSGVEASPGQKDLELLTRFFEQLRGAVNQRQENLQG